MAMLTPEISKMLLQETWTKLAIIVGSVDASAPKKGQNMANNSEKEDLSTWRGPDLRP